MKTTVKIWLLAICLFAFGCQKENELKTAAKVRVHEITTVSLDSSETVYWYIFHKGGKFIYTKSGSPIEDFSSTFFLSSKKIPKELKFTEEFIVSTSADSSDEWGFETVELQDDTFITDSMIVDSVGADSTFIDSLKLDSLKIDPVVKDSLDDTSKVWMYEVSQ